MDLTVPDGRGGMITLRNLPDVEQPLASDPDAASFQDALGRFVRENPEQIPIAAATAATMLPLPQVAIPARLGALGAKLAPKIPGALKEAASFGGDILDVIAPFTPTFKAGAEAVGTVGRKVVAEAPMIGKATAGAGAGGLLESQITGEDPETTARLRMKENLTAEGLSRFFVFPVFSFSLGVGRGAVTKGGRKALEFAREHGAPLFPRSVLSDSPNILAGSIPKALETAINNTFPVLLKTNEARRNIANLLRMPIDEGNKLLNAVVKSGAKDLTVKNTLKRVGSIQDSLLVTANRLGDSGADKELKSLLARAASRADLSITDELFDPSNVRMLLKLKEKLPKEDFQALANMQVVKMFQQSATTTAKNVNQVILNGEQWLQEVLRLDSPLRAALGDDAVKAMRNLGAYAHTAARSVLSSAADVGAQRLAGNVAGSYIVLSALPGVGGNGFIGVPDDPRTVTSEDIPELLFGTAGLYILAGQLANPKTPLNRWLTTGFLDSRTLETLAKEVVATGSRIATQKASTALNTAQDAASTSVQDASLLDMLSQ